MDESVAHGPHWLRNEAEHCFRIASNLSDKKAHDALIEYGQELVERAEKMEAVLGGSAKLCDEM